MTTDLSSEGKQTRKQWNDIFKGLKGKKNQPKIIFKNKSKIIFPNKQSEKISCQYTYIIRNLKMIFRLKENNTE